jgi:hypothetical protein
MESAIYALLSGAASVAALVGTRIYPVQCPESAVYPAVRYLVISVEQPHALTTDPAVRGVRVQVDAIATTYAVATQIRDAVRTALGRYRGAAGTLTAQDVLEEDVLAPVADLDTGLYVAGVDLVCWLEG